MVFRSTDDPDSRCNPSSLSLSPPAQTNGAFPGKESQRGKYPVRGGTNSPRPDPPITTNEQSRFIDGSAPGHTVDIPSMVKGENVSLTFRLFTTPAQLRYSPHPILPFVIAPHPVPVPIRHISEAFDPGHRAPPSIEYPPRRRQVINQSR
jgi:hypothetical protein